MSASVPAQAGAPPVSMAESAARIESLLGACAAGGPVSQSRAEDLVACVSALYGSGLARILEILRETGSSTPTVLGALAADELVSGLLLVHDLHPDDITVRVARALDSVRPYLGSHGGDVELIGIGEDGVARLRLLGSCDGCPSSAVTLELAVEGAVNAAAPELRGIEVESGAATVADPKGVISLDSLRVRLDRPAEPSGAGWVSFVELGDLVPGELAGFEVDGLRVCACRLGNDVFCFRDRCAHCGQSLAGGVVERRLGEAAGGGVLRCAHCRAHFDVRRAGAGLDNADEHLDPLPVLVSDGTASVAVPAGAS